MAHAWTGLCSSKDAVGDVLKRHLPVTNVQVSVIGGECLVDLDILAAVLIGEGTVDETNMNTTDMAPEPADVEDSPPAPAPEPMPEDIEPEAAPPTDEMEIDMMMEEEEPPAPAPAPVPEGPPVCAGDPEPCVRNRRQCGGRGFDNPVGCCDPEFECVVTIPGDNPIATCIPADDVRDRPIFCIAQ